MACVTAQVTLFVNETACSDTIKKVPITRFILEVFCVCGHLKTFIKVGVLKHCYANW